MKNANVFIPLIILVAFIRSNMGQKVVIFDFGPRSSTNKSMIYCNKCQTYTTTFEYISDFTINKTVLPCRSCKHPLPNLEELSKKPEKRLEFHKNV